MKYESKSNQRPRFDILICNDDILELPVHVCSTIQEAINWLECGKSILYKSLHLDGYMHYNNYKIEMIKRSEA